ncbi:hypothetical protein [Sinorhizobium americanum]|uniref:hypothetical protein n=1 Tax=Sinorhizobium americanum TaxID=194963 RepID=UPI00056432F3|nr:hypothetical protein [Sinorhizobium americanum]
MTSDHLATLWKWISLACFGYVASSVLTLQGATDIFGTSLIAREDHGLAVVAYFAVVVGGALMCVAFAIAITYARRHGTAWHNRVPVIMLDGLQTASVEGKLFQAAVIFVLVVLPLYGLGHCMRVANNGDICVQDTSPPVVHRGGNWDLLAIPRAEGQMRLLSSGLQDQEECRGGVEISWYTPVLFGGLPFLSALLTSIWAALLFRGPAQGPLGRFRGR